MAVRSKFFPILPALVLSGLLAGGLSGCSTLLYVRSPQQRIYSEPVFESSKIFFFMGLVGGPRDVYVDQICLGKDIDQISTEYTTSDVLKGFLTLGIYTPRTVKVWCQL